VKVWTKDVDAMVYGNIEKSDKKWMTVQPPDQSTRSEWKWQFFFLTRKWQFLILSLNQMDFFLFVLLLITLLSVYRLSYQSVRFHHIFLLKISHTILIDV
jgi:hypothetical protein